MMPSRKGYWISLALLLAAVPVALTIKTWDDIQTWRSQHERQAEPGEVGKPVGYAGAQWTVTRFTRMAGENGSAAVLAEFEAMTADPGALASTPCRVRLSDEAGRTWHQTVFADPVIGKRYPETASLGLCGGPTFATTERGKPAKMVATFSVPVTATGLHLSIALYSALPRYLSISEPKG
jgi:hypothetical protein